MLHVPTTDEMDSTTPEDRLKLVIMCGDCGTWIHWTGRDGLMLQSSGAPPCPECGGVKHAPRSIISERTWDADRAKKETAALLRKKKK